MRRALPVAAGVLCSVLACAPKWTRNPDVSHDPRAAHAQADTNGDGYVDLEEFRRRLTDWYFHADRDKDGAMSFDEMDAAVVIRSDWTRVDRNHDSAISLREWIEDRTVLFHRADTDRDQRLSVAEVVDIFERNE